jgi:dienelactone hydrolase
LRPTPVELVIAPFFHAWERRLASVTTNRIVREFDWGLDWVPLAARSDQRDGPERLHQWVDEAMQDSQAFFDAPATTEYRYHQATASLSFPSAITTPHPENNIVRARWFPAATEPAIGAPGTRGRAVILLPQWNADAEGHVGLAKLLARFGISALRLSLPYHDARMPPELTRADYIVSSNVARTLQVCRQAVLDTRRAISWLHAQGFERIGILGTSLGSCLAMLTTAHEPLIRAQALNHISPRFADVVWRGLSTRHVRQGLDGRIDLDRLRNLWRPISPTSYLDRVGHARTLLVYARYDLTFPVDLSRELVEAFRERRLPHDTAVLPCGHYSTGTAPFKYLDGYLLIRFLRKNL